MLRSIKLRMGVLGLIFVPAYDENIIPKDPKQLISWRINIADIDCVLYGESEDTLATVAGRC